MKPVLILLVLSLGGCGTLTNVAGKVDCPGINQVSVSKNAQGDIDIDACFGKESEHANLKFIKVDEYEMVYDSDGQKAGQMQDSAIKANAEAGLAAVGLARDVINRAAP